MLSLVAEEERVPAVALLYVGPGFEGAVYINQDAQLPRSTQANRPAGVSALTPSRSCEGTAPCSRRDERGLAARLSLPLCGRVDVIGHVARRRGQRFLDLTSVGESRR